MTAIKSHPYCVDDEDNVSYASHDLHYTNEDSKHCAKPTGAQHYMLPYPV